MHDAVTIVMYHYVRDLRHSRYPEIKGLDQREFEEQIRYIKRHYTVISGGDLMDAVVEGKPLPRCPLLLTFDDGYIDHFANVFPTLDREGLSGCFFPPARCILEHKVLDVNKIHFILASVPDKRVIVEFLMRAIESNRSIHNLRSPAEYWDAIAKSSRFDTAEVVFCKRVLQRELPLELRLALTDELFRRYVSVDEASFSRELYMNVDQLRVLQNHGMYVGSHGYDHFWLNTLTTAQQEREIDLSLEFLRSVGADTRRWIMCYPYGGYNESLLSVLKARICAVGLTTKVGLASVKNGSILEMPRLDTNDLPKDGDVPPNEWTLKAASNC